MYFGRGNHSRRTVTLPGSLGEESEAINLDMAEGRIRGCGAHVEAGRWAGTSMYLCVCAQLNVPRTKWRQLPADLRRGTPGRQSLMPLF